MDIINDRDLKLLEYIKNTDEMAMPRLQAFQQFAYDNNLKCETVRNLYYNLVKKYDLNDEYKIMENKAFSEKELDILMAKIIKEYNKNKSIRKACYIVSSGDAKLMLRLQNKFRSLLKNDREYLIKLGYKEVDFSHFDASKINSKDRLNLGQIAINNNENRLQNMPFDNTKNNAIKSEEFNRKSSPKVLKMPNNSTSILTDSDINNLFMGLVKMVKRNAIENAPKFLKNEYEEANASLKDALVKLGASTRKLEVIKCENFELKQKLKKSERLLENTRCEVVELINKIDNVGKIEDLQNFLNEYKKKITQKSLDNLK